MLRRISIRTESRIEFRDISAELSSIISDSGVKDGICHVICMHTTAGLTINENADPDVVIDIKARLAALVPEQASYRHSEGNSDAHIKASLIGNSTTLAIENGKPLLGTWQGIHFCEFDGPRNRTVLVKIIPDS
jgi:secondary thiamine-phosphate synthase enzyme